MKIKPDIYQSLKTDIAAVAKAFNASLAGPSLKPLYAALSIVSRDRAYEDSHPCFVNGKWKRCLPYDGRDYCWYYAGECNDTHLATALKAIQKELTSADSLRDGETN